MSSPKVLSIFSGAGGLDLGFHQVGFDIKACIELDKDACDSLKLNRGKHFSEKTLVYCEDITKLSPESVYKDIGDIDFIIGGPPCQSFSAAGRRAGGVSGINDTRGSLFWFYAQYLKRFRPKGFLFENVKGILQANNSEDWDIVKKSFHSLGYNLNYRILDAADYGTPQHRERVILVGHLMDDKDFLFPRPVYGPNSLENKPYVAPKDAFKDIDDPHEIVPPYTGKYGHLLNDIPPGMNYSFYTERMGHPNPIFAWRSKFSGFLYKLDPEKPSKTLVAHQGKYDGPFHWKNRKLKINELIRIQGFPIDYKFSGSRISVQKQIGNSVSPKLSYFLAKAVFKQLFESIDLKIELMGKDEKLKPKKISSKRIKPKSINSNSYLQNDLFENKEIIFKNEDISLEIHSEEFKNKCYFRDGNWSIELDKKRCEAKKWLEIDVNFFSLIGKKFKNIKCLIKSDTYLDFNVAWDFIHEIVNYSCSYGSLQPLYGHFTEPYPKFSVSVKGEDENDPFFKLMSKMSNFDFLNQLNCNSLLYGLFGSDVDLRKLVHLLREKGIDIRTHETNRTIPKNKFRICYPFTIPTWQPTYTKYTELGSHANNDVNIKEIMSGG